jgi:osmotically-inducible protein OsmY
VPQAGTTKYTESILMKNDIQIQQEVLAEIDHDDKVPAGSVGVEVHHGVVKLAGPESDATIKENVELDARRVDGVTKVVVDMDVAQR